MKKGFTLVELVIVIVILGILAAVAVPRFIDITGSAKDAACKGALGGLRSAVSLYYAQYAINNNGLTKWPNTADLNANMIQGIPANPWAGTAVATIMTVTGGTPGSGDTAAYGWILNTADGKVYASNNVGW
jgi:MSHA pilin protein MshA